MEALTEVELCDIVRAECDDSRRARAAFAELYTRSYDMAMAHACKLFGGRDRAEDAVSEAYAKTLQALRRDLGPRESFRAYLLTAVKTETLRRFAIDRITDVIDVVDQDEFAGSYSRTAPDRVDEVAERDQLVRAFTSLPDWCQQVLFLIDVQDRVPAEVAKRLGLKPRAMNSRLFRAREYLRIAYLQQYAERAQSGCQGIVPMLGRFVRGSLRSRHSAGVASHLEECARCREQFDRLQRINGNLRAWIGPVGVGLGAGGALAGSCASGASAPGAAALGFANLKVGLLLTSVPPLKWAAGAVGAGVMVAVAATSGVQARPAEIPFVESDETKYWIEIDS